MSGWKVGTEGIEYEWTSGDIVPQELIDILCASGDEQGNETDQDADEMEMVSLIDEIFDDHDDGDGDIHSFDLYLHENVKTTTGERKIIVHIKCLFSTVMNIEMRYFIYICVSLTFGLTYILNINLKRVNIKNNANLFT